MQRSLSADPEWDRFVDSTRWRGEYDLTDRQQRVFLALAAGHHPADFARRHRLTEQQITDAVSRLFALGLFRVCLGMGEIIVLSDSGKRLAALLLRRREHRIRARVR